MEENTERDQIRRMSRLCTVEQRRVEVPPRQDPTAQNHDMQLEPPSNTMANRRIGHPNKHHWIQMHLCPKHYELWRTSCYHTHTRWGYHCHAEWLPNVSLHRQRSLVTRIPCLPRANLDHSRLLPLRMAHVHEQAMLGQQTPKCTTSAIEARHTQHATPTP